MSVYIEIASLIGSSWIGRIRTRGGKLQEHHYDVSKSMKGLM
jgi:hypothetical protein